MPSNLIVPSKILKSKNKNPSGSNKMRNQALEKMFIGLLPANMKTLSPSLYVKLQRDKQLIDI